MWCVSLAEGISARRDCVVDAFCEPISRWLVLLLCLLLPGCGGAPAGQPATVRGTVKFKGEPLPKGSIRLATEDGTPGPGGVSPIEDGHYEIAEDTGMKAGKYLVIINAFKKTGRKIKVDEAGTEREEEKQYLPRRYTDDSTEHLELVPGENTKDYELTN